MALARSDISIADVTPGLDGASRFNWHKPDDQNQGITSWDSLHNFYMGKIYKFHTSRYSTLLQRWSDFDVAPKGSSTGVQFVKSLYPRGQIGCQVNITGVGFIIDGDVNSILSRILFGVRVRIGDGTPSDTRRPIEFINFYNPDPSSSPVNYIASGDTLQSSNSCAIGSGSTKARIMYSQKKLGKHNYFYVPLGSNNQTTSGIPGFNTGSYPGMVFGGRCDKDTITQDQNGASLGYDVRGKPGAFANSYYDGSLNYPYATGDIADKTGTVPPFQTSQNDAQDVFVEFQTAGVTERMYNTDLFNQSSSNPQQTLLLNFKMFDLYGHVTYLDY